MTDPDNWVSPTSQRKDFSDPYTLADKLRIFEERVDGWQLTIAEEMLTQINAQSPKSMQHAAYAMISVIFSYFEMIGNCLVSASGATSKFKAGFKSVFSKLGLSNKQLAKIYSQVRCGLYHVAYTKRGVIIDGTFTDVIKITGTRIEMNPHLLIPAVRTHFKQFMVDLKAKQPNDPMISRFEALFNS